MRTDWLLTGRLVRQLPALPSRLDRPEGPVEGARISCCRHRNEVGWIKVLARIGKVWGLKGVQEAR